MATATEQQQGAGVHLLTGSEVMAHVCRLADVDVITAYPIRPYDTVMQYVSKFIAEGDFDADYIPAESEHGQFEIVKHASACGAARVHRFERRGLALCDGAACRYGRSPPCPMVALVGCRALDDPGAFGTEHNDAMLVRDLGWMINFPDTAQEVVELGLLSYRVAEDPESLPAVRHRDGRRVPDAQPGDGAAARPGGSQRVPPRPMTGATCCFTPTTRSPSRPQANEDWLMEVRRPEQRGRRKTAYTVLKEAHADFSKTFGVDTDPFLDEYMTEDADVVLCGMGTAEPAGEGRHPRDAQGRQEGRHGSPQVVPPLPRRKSCAHRFRVSRRWASSTVTTRLVLPIMVV